MLYIHRIQRTTWQKPLQQSIQHRIRYQPNHNLKNPSLCLITTPANHFLLFFSFKILFKIIHQFFKLCYNQLMAKTLSPVSWEAEEYIAREHHFGWYIGLFIVAAALSALAIFLGGWTFLILIILSVITILIYSLRPPRKIHYKLDNRGLTEDKTLHKYEDFRAFGILNESSHYSAVLIPKKRFSLQVKVYFPEGSGEGIVDQLGNHLPMEEVKLDFLDKIVNFLRI